MRAAPDRTPPRVRAVRTAGLCLAAGAAGLAASGCATLRDEGFTAGKNCDPVVRDFDRAELMPRPGELAGDEWIGLGYAAGEMSPGGAIGMSHVGCGPAGCGPGCAATGGAFAAARAQIERGGAAERADRPDLAVGHYRQALAADPHAAAAHHRLAVLLDGAQQFPAAERHYAAALAARPHDADLLCDHGYSLLLQGRTDEAEVRLRTALSKAPDHARSLENLGLLYARRGDRAAAAAALAATGGTDLTAKLALLFPADAQNFDAPPAAAPAPVAPAPVAPAVKTAGVQLAAAVTTPAVIAPAVATAPALVTAPARVEPTGLPTWGGAETPTPAAAVAPPAARSAGLPLWPPVGGFSTP